MYLKSLFPPVPELPIPNLVNLTLHRPDQQDWPEFTSHIDVVTGKSRTNKEYLKRISLGATALGASDGMGLSPENGDMVGILSDNCLDYYVIVNSLLTITTPFALLPSHSKQFELVHLLKLSQLSKLFVQPKYLESARAASKQVGLSEDNIFLLEGASPGKISLDDLIRDVEERKVPAVDIRPAEKDTLAYLVFSSGTTGLPKGVMVSHGNLIFSLLQIMTFQRVANGDEAPPTLNTKEGIPIALAYLPLYHSYGLHVSVFRAGFIPCTQLIFPKWDLETAIRAIPKYRVSHLALIPSVIHQLVTHPAFNMIDWSSVVMAGSGAAHLPRDLNEKFVSRLGIPDMAQGYGCSEVTISVTSNTRSGVLPGITCPLNSVGLLLPGMEARIVRNDGTDADVNETGELWVRGPNVTMGYYNNPEATKEVFLPDGWLKTGDQFRADEKGMLFFEDRGKDTLKVSGSQVSPSEIELALRAHPDKLCADVVVAGVSGGRTADEKVPRAWVVLSEEGKRRGEAASIDSLNAWVQENLTKYKWLRGGIEIVDEIPKNPTGKILRRILQDKFEAQQVELKAKM